MMPSTSGNRVLIIAFSVLVFTSIAGAQSPAAPNPSVCQRQLAPVLTRLFRKDCADITAQDLAAITELKIDEMRIRSWGPEELQGLGNLRSLKVVDKRTQNWKTTEVENIEDNAFASLKKLEEIEIESEHTVTVSPTAFWGLTSLKHLNVHDLKTASGTIPSTFLKDSPQLESLSLRLRGLSKIEEDLFQYAKDTLTFIAFPSYSNSCEVDRLPNGLFRGLSKLSSLHFGCNLLSPITRADDTLFRDLVSLESLHWTSRMTIEAMPPLPPSLKLIMMENVTFASPMPDVFAGLNRLEVLWMTLGGRQVLLSSRALENLSSLKDLRIEYGAFDAFPLLPAALKSIVLTTHFGGPMAPTTFQNMANLETLVVVDPSLGSLPKELFKGSNKLRRVEFPNCGLTELPFDFFEHLPQCHFIPNGHGVGCSFDFRYNQLTNFFPRIFSKVLGSFNLSKNPVATDPVVLDRIQKECPDCSFTTNGY